MRDPEFYVNDEEVVTVYYRRQDTDDFFEDNCPEYIWKQLLEDKARAAE